MSGMKIEYDRYSVKIDGKGLLYGPVQYTITDCRR